MICDEYSITKLRQNPILRNDSFSLPDNLLSMKQRSFKVK